MTKRQLAKHRDYTHRRLRPPIIELEDDALRDVELDFTAALNGMETRPDATCLTDCISPHFAVNFDGSAVATIVIFDHEVGLPVLRLVGCAS